MTPFWFWVSIGCELSALLGFCAVRFGVRWLQGVGDRGLRRQATPEHQVMTLVASAPAVREVAVQLPSREAVGSAAPRTANGRPALAVRSAAAVSRPAPAPTTPRPEAEKLALWTRQVRNGERRFSLATDGCRVTWNRRCKHGHPSWLVHLGLLASRETVRRHRAR